MGGKDRLTEEEEAKLKGYPRWLRDYVLHLEIDLKACHKSLAERRETKTLWGFESATQHGMAHGYIPDDESVRFFLDEKRRRWIEFRRDKVGRLRMYGSHGIVMAFQSSNLATLTTDSEGEWIQ